MAISKDLEETSADVTETSGFVLTSVLTAHLLTLLTGHFTYEKRRGREWSRREPSDIDEAQRVNSRERANQSNQGVGRKPRYPTKPSEILRRGRESNPRIAVLQTATLPLGYPADLRERTISLSLRLYQLAKVFGVKRRA
jgi:hypothetical protein